ncbi:MAG TPA: NADP-dependent isocitrate dehydrogenase [Candidatus Limnocylindrales bacterium]|nr:NADP-dependent isocitrate dehydrogenase [Candidatus Limnocylindrales bacterium]
MTSQPTAAPHPVTVIPGDGVGPEIVAAARRVVDATGVRIAWEDALCGAAVFRAGDSSGVPADTRASIERTCVVLKGPLETPVGFGEKSANVTLRKLFETYANVRPARELPGVPTRYRGEGVDMVIVRENIEDLYAGIEHLETPDVGQCLKIISRKGSEKVIRYAFELARREGRSKVTCATKANIMKLTEGLFKRVFEELAQEYPGIEAQHLIIDNAAHQLVKEPAQFDVVVTTNLNGDIISDLASGLVGGLGFAASGNYGDRVAIFEAVHGSAPKYAGKDVINPTAIILSAAMMLRHLGESSAAQQVEDAVFVTLESGAAVTQDLARQSGGDVEQAASTTRFTDTIIENLGRRPKAELGRPRTPDPEARPLPRWDYSRAHYAAIARRQVGVDVMVESDLPIDELGPSLAACAEAGAGAVGGSGLRLDSVAARGTKIYPGEAVGDTVRWYTGRFVAPDGEEPSEAQVLALLGRVAERHHWTQVERLQTFDGEPGYTKAQGE